MLGRQQSFACWLSFAVQTNRDMALLYNAEHLVLLSHLTGSRPSSVVSAGRIVRCYYGPNVYVRVLGHVPVSAAYKQHISGAGGVSAAAVCLPDPGRGAAPLVTLAGAVDKCLVLRRRPEKLHQDQAIGDCIAAA